MAGFSDFMEKWILDTLFTSGFSNPITPDQVYVALCYGDPETALSDPEVPDLIGGNPSGYARQRVYFTVTQVNGLTVAKNTHFDDPTNGKTPGGVEFPIASCDWQNQITHLALYSSLLNTGSNILYFSAPLTVPKYLTIGDQFRIRVNDLAITLD